MLVQVFPQGWEPTYFYVTSSTCATYLWSNMAAPALVIICALQLVGQKIILPFGSDISLLLKFHWPKYLPCSWQTWGLWAHRRAGECDPISEHSRWVTGTTTLHSYPCIHSSLILPTQLSAVTCRYGYWWGYKRGHNPGCKIWRKQERKEDKKL